MIMQLKDFVRESLVQVVDGIVEAQKRTEESNAIVSPYLPPSRSQGTRPDVFSSPNLGIVQMFEFDVAVTVSKDDAKEGGVAVVAAVLGAGGKVRSEKQFANVSRLKFSVPVVLPHSGKD